MRRLYSLLRGERSERGTTIVEFALLAPVMFLLICGAMDLGYLYLAQTSLNGALLQAARLNAVSMEKSENDRQAAMRASITETMSPYSDVQPVVDTKVFKTFASSQPEPYIDTNNNGQYDPPAPPFPGEAFTDRNGNGKWDASIPLTSGAQTMGDVGDVVSYLATLDVQHLFPIYFNGKKTISLRATAVVRNEATKTE